MTLLDKLDEFFNAQKETEQKITFIMTILLIFFISYYFIYPYTDEMYRESTTTHRKLKRDINTKEMNIIRLRGSIVRLKHKNDELKAEIKELSKTENIMKKLLKKVRFLIFNLDRWADIYNKIPNYVNNSNLLLLQLDNNLFLNNKENNKNNTKLVNLKMRITLKVMGDFLNVIKLINIFESNKELVKIVALKSNGIITSITINVYGAEL